MKAEPIAGELARFVEALGIDNIPPEVALRARYLILDAIGCAMAARREEFATRFWSATKALAGDASGTAGVIGYAERVPLRDAAVLNGVLMHGLDYDDTHLAGVIHLTVAVLPAVLNLASRRKLSGADLLVAYIAGLETGARIAMAARSGIHAQGFHTTAVVGTFAAAWAAGRLMRLDANQLVQAQGAALSMAAGSLQFIEDGGWTKRLHAGWAAQAGITAATLASEGIVAPSAPYTGRYGLFHSYLDEAGRQGIDLALATHALAGGADEPVWELTNIAVKPYAMCHFVHAATDAAIVLHRLGIGSADIRDIEVLVPQEAVPIVCEPSALKRRPRSDYEAKFSLPYAVAAGLTHGQLGLKELEPSAYLDVKAQALMDRVRYVVDPDSTFPRGYGGEVRVTLADGTHHRHREALNRGSAEIPLSNAEVRDKFMDNATRHFPPAHARAVCDLVLGLDHLKSASVLEDLLARDPDDSPGESGCKPR